MIDNNTRRYPRTLGEAFKDASYADPIERPERSYPASWWLAMACIAVATILVVV